MPSAHPIELARAGMFQRERAPPRGISLFDKGIHEAGGIFPTRRASEGPLRSRTATSRGCTFFESVPRRCSSTHAPWRHTCAALLNKQSPKPCSRDQRQSISAVGDKSSYSDPSSLYLSLSSVGIIRQPPALMTSPQASASSGFLKQPASGTTGLVMSKASDPSTAWTRVTFRSISSRLCPRVNRLLFHCRPPE